MVTLPFGNRYKLKDIFELYAGGDVDVEHFSKYKTYTHQFSVYSNSLSDDGLYGYTSKPKYKRDSLTITGRGSVGHAMYRSQDFDAIVRLLVLTPKFKDVVDSRYITALINQYISFPFESTGVPQLTTLQIQNIEVCLPDFKEQTAIAEALSDVDNLITSLQKLIAKKKAIKQGAMQELLTGKKRLPGFSSNWIQINLADKSKLKARIGWQGLTTAEYLTHGFAYLITGTYFANGKIDWKHCHYVDKKRYDQDVNIQIKNADVLITKDGTIGKVAYVHGLNYPATLNSGVFVIRPIKEDSYSSEFVYHIMNSFVFEDFLTKLSAGSTINHLYQKDLVGFNFMVPSTIEEQMAIAQILSDMDTEIEQLEKKLSKYQQIKQGMMQELLTGRIRLVDTNVETKAAEHPKKHNQQFDDAVMIAGIVNAFYSDKYPLGRKKVQKLLYLLRRKQQADMAAFKKKAAGPYADTVRYKGGEPIAKSSGYIAVKQSDKGSSFGRGTNIGQALDYIQKWDIQPDIDWLTSEFQYTNVNELELLATVDMAICDLHDSGKSVSVKSIKELVCSTKEWREKLKKVYFKDNDIQRAIDRCQELFGEQ